MTRKPAPEDKVAVSGPQIIREGIDDWRLVLDKLVARFETGGFSAGAALVGAIANVADEANHHPDVDLRYPHLTVSLVSHDVGAITQRDIRLARRISELAADAGAPAAAHAPDVIGMALDTPDHAAVKPFWQAMLGYQESSSAHDELKDGAARSPSVWFQESKADAPDRQRWHLDISVPAELAQARVQAALSAGGTLVSDEAAPSFWVLADPEGNQGCICTWQGRSQWADQSE